MEYTEFRNRIVEAVPAGTVLRNPKKGTSTIRSYENDRIKYIRGQTPFYVTFIDLYYVYHRYKGGRVDTGMIKNFNPEVFDQPHGGHVCHCTFF